MPACDLDRSVAFCFYNKREKRNTIVSVFSGEVHPTTKERILSRRDKMKVARHEYVFSAFLRELRRSKIFRWLRKRGSAKNWECSFPG